MYIDAHCHLEAQTYGSELDEVIARAFDAGLTHLIAVGASSVTAGAREVVALAARLDAVYAAVGIHPHDAGKAQDHDLSALAELLREPKVVALGEIGLDYYYDHAPQDVQRALFAKLLALGRERNLPVMLHVRDAHADTLKLIDEVGLPERGGVVHCFTGGPAEARDYVARGMYLSIPGIVTFKNAEALREAVRGAPSERLLIETDSPYLAPVPHRGKRNEPALLVHTAAALGTLLGLSAEDVGRITAENAIRLFGLAKERKTALAYPIRNSLYVNVTSRCTLACVFCPKIEKRDWWVKGHWLRLPRDPPVEDVLAAIDSELARRPALEEVVFVGLGEPTLRLDGVLAIAGALREKFARRLRIRLDTDGLANLVHGRDVTRELARVIDAVSVSLNAADPATYAKLCPSKYREAAYPAVKDFIRAAKAAGLAVTASVVGVPGLDLEKARRVAEDELGVTFRHRVYQQYG